MTDVTASWLAERLFAASTQGAVVIALVWLVCRTMRGLPAAVHATLWWLAALKLLLAFTPAPSIEIPLLPSSLRMWFESRPLDVSGAAGHTPVRSQAGAAALNEDGRSAAAADYRESRGRDFARPVEADLQAGRRNSTTAAADRFARWRDMAVGIWLTLVLAHAVRLLWEFRTLRRLVRRANAWPDDRAEELTALAARVALDRAPKVCLSDQIDGPQVSGVWRPTVLLPASVMALTDDERTMVVCHELMHIRRRDLVMGWVPAVAERLFLFHPLARLAAREYLVAREAACDAAVVRTLGVAPADYGQLLVRLGVSASPAVFAAGGAPLSKSSLRRRLEMLQHIQSTGRPYWRWAVVAVLLALIPLQLVARTPERRVPPAEVPQSISPAETTPSSSVALPESRLEPQAEPIARELRQAERTLELVTPDALREIERSLEELRRITEDTSAQEQMRSTIAELAQTFERKVAAERTQLESASTRATREQVFALIESMGAQRGSVDTLQVIDRWMQLERNARSSMDAGDSLRAHMDQLRVQQETLTRQLEQMARQHEQLAAAQQQIAEQAEQLRQLIEARSR